MRKQRASKGLYRGLTKGQKGRQETTTGPCECRALEQCHFNSIPTQVVSLIGASDRVNGLVSEISALVAMACYFF